jgi:hypothetical protein
VSPSMLMPVASPSVSGSRRVKAQLSGQADGAGNGSADGGAGTVPVQASSHAGEAPDNRASCSI